MLIMDTALSLNTHFHIVFDIIAQLKLKINPLQVKSNKFTNWSKYFDA